MSEHTPLLSVVVCTYNRASLLPGCLQSLADQTADSADFEIILVNNKCTDETPQIAKEWSKKLSHMRVVLEKKQGLSRARNRGWKEAKGAYVAYMDDDAKARPEWVAIQLALIAEQPDLDAFGGPYEAFSTVPIPKWFRSDWGSWDQGPEQHAIGPDEWLCGSNMVFRKLLLAKMGGFDPTLGMKGEQLGYGEEVALVRAMVADSKRVVYVPELVIDHLVAPYKFVVVWWWLSAYNNGRHNHKVDGQALRTAWAETAELLISCLRQPIRMLTCGERHFKTRLVVAGTPLAWRVGVWVATLKKGR